jgi:hypothetical protein
MARAGKKAMQFIQGDCCVTVVADGKAILHGKRVSRAYLKRIVVTSSPS